MTILRRKQLKLFQNLTMFEQRILCHKLPKSFDRFRIDIDGEECVNKRNKKIQEFKRRMLNIELEKYEMKIQHYEDLFQQDLAAFLIEISYPRSASQKGQVDILTHFVKSYLNHHTNRFIHQIRYKEACVHIKFLRHYRRYSSLAKKTIDVYPQVIVDASKVLLNSIQLDYLSRNGK